MRIQRDGLVFRIASLIGESNLEKTDMVNACLLLRYFVHGLLLVIVMNVCTWLAIVLLTIPALILRTGLFFCGKKMVRNKHPLESSLNEWGPGLFTGTERYERLMGRYYDVVPIERMPTFRGFRIMPVYLILFAIAGAASWFLVREFSHLVVLVSTGPYPYLRTMLGFILVTLIAGYLLGRFWRRLVESEAGQLFFAYLKAQKDRACPIVDIIDAGDPDVRDVP